MSPRRGVSALSVVTALLLAGCSEFVLREPPVVAPAEPPAEDPDAADVLIVGAGSGVSASFARVLAEHGYRLVLASRNAAASA